MTIDIEKLAKENKVYVEGEGIYKQYICFESALTKFAEAYASKVHDKRVEELEAKNRELSASINDLREALEENHYSNSTEKAINLYKRALSKTPAQSLQEHDNEVIERCAKVCDRFDNYGLADKIRALKVSND